MSASDYLEGKVLGYVYTGEAFAQPGTKYLALYTAAPTDAAGSGTEISGNGYARQACAFTKTGSGPTQVANTSQFDYPAATGSGWGTVTHWATHDAPAGGNPLNHGALAASKAIGPGDIMRIPAATIVITLD